MTVCSLFLLGANLNASAAVFVVINATDSDAGSLRQALLDSNASIGVLDTITFDIPGTGVRTITLLSALPTITDPVVIDGYTQPGSSANTLAVGDNSIHLIELDGSNAALGANGLTITAGNSTVRGLVINRFRVGSDQQTGGNAIDLLTNGGNIIEGNFIGTDAAGLAILGNDSEGVDITNSSSNNRVGGTTPAARNLISGNRVGVDIRNDLGGGATSGNVIQGNFIGTDRNGTASLANRIIGVFILGTGNGPVNNNLIGGSVAGAQNLVSGNPQGLEIAGVNATANQVQGNLIGTDVSGTAALGNTGLGVAISVSASNNTIGGLANGTGNIIAFNTGAGVALFDGGTTGNAIQGNSIFSNSSLGINLSNDGVTPNDTGDSDTGPNNLQNFPVLTSVSSSSGNTTIVGTLNSLSTTEYRLEFFANNAVDPSGHGEGQSLIGSTTVTTDANGDASFNVSVSQIAAGQRVTATATDPLGNTSEFSAAIGQLLNISSRLRVQTGENVLIGGFIITGTDPKKVIARGIGPSLTAVGVEGALANPVLELHGPGTFVTIMNDNWRLDQQAEIEATGIAPTNDLESAIVATLPANNSGYTAIVRGSDNTIGVGVVEAYDLDTAVNSKLGNISTRGLVETGNDVLIAGFIAGNGVTKVIIRAIGPSLSNAGVSNPLLDPTVELFNGSGTSIALNNDWRATQETEIIATTIPPSDDRESAIVASLIPGSYTAVVRGTNDTTGIAVVEVYNIQ